MPDFGAPIAQNVNVNPQQGIQTLSGILGLKQQQLDIQQSEARVYQAQQGARERQGLASVPWKSFQNPDGSMDIDKATAAAQQVAPTTWPDFMQRFAAASEGGAETKKAWYGLNQMYQDGLRSIYGTWGGDPNADIVDLQKQIDVFKATAPKSAQGQIDQIQSHLAKILTGPDMITGADQTPAQQKQRALAYSRAGLGQEQVSGTGGLATPIPGTAVGKSGALVGTAQSRTTAALSQPPGAVGLGLTPTQTPGYLAQAATATGAAAGQVGTDNQVFGRVLSAGADAQRGIELAQKVENEAGQVRTGMLSQELANRLTIARQHDPSITARQLLQKDAANLKTLAESTATTDQERAQVGSGFPTPETMDPDAVQKAARYWQGSFRMAGARRDVAVSHVAENGSTAGLALKDSQFMSQAAPGKFAPPEPQKTMPTGAKLTNYANTHFGGNTAAATAFLKQHGYQ